MWVFPLGLFVVVISLGCVVFLLFPRVMPFLFIARSPMMVLGGHGCCGMRVCGCRVGVVDLCMCVGYCVLAGQFGSRGGKVVLQVFLGLRGGCWR